MPIHGPEPAPLQAIATYAQALRNLTDEIAGAIRSIADNRITELRSSLARQHAQCADLRIMAAAVQDLSQRDPAFDPEQDPVLAAARQDLIQMTRAYQNLLERGRRSTSMLASLCCSHTGQYRSGPQPMRGRFHLSCEA